METGSGFRVCGYVVRKFVAPSGKVAFLVIDVPGEKGRSSKIDLRAFDAEVIGDVGSLNVGAKAEMTGRIDVEKLAGKDRNPVTVDGRDAWVTKLTVRTVKVDGASIPAKPKQPAITDDPFDGPEGW